MLDLLLLLPLLYSQVKDLPHTFKNVQGLYITDIKIKKLDDKTYATITVNNILQIKEIEIQNSNSDFKLKMPTYISKKGKPYPQIKIISKNFYDLLLKTIKENKPAKIPNPPKLKYKLTKLQPLKSSYRICNIEITFNDAFVVVCGVLKKRDDSLSFVWPSRKEEFGFWYEQVILTDKDLKNEIEEKILNKVKYYLEETKE